MNKKPSIYLRFDSDVLQDMYINKEKTVGEIAKELGVAQSTVLSAMMYWRIPRRPGGNKQQTRQAMNEAELRRLYCEEHHNITAIAQQLQVSPRSVRVALRSYGIAIKRGPKPTH